MLDNPPAIEIVGTSKARIWGLNMVEWQTRTFRKAGATGQGEARILIDANTALSPNLVRALIASPNTALTNAEGQIVAAHSSGSSDVVGQTAAPGLTLMDAPTLGGGYDKALRKMEPAYILDMRTEDPETVMRKQFASSYKGITDFVTKWFWPKPAYYVTRFCANLGLTPNQVTTVGFILCLTAFWAFWTGQWWLGFATGWMMTFLDTVDGKLARTTMTYSKWGNVYDHGIDLVHPPFWYWAWWVGLGVTLSGQGLTRPEWVFTALIAILIGYVVDRIIEGIFLAQFGMHIHVWTRFNSALRFFIARRNPNTFIMMVGMILTVVNPMAGVWAFGAIAAWTWICILLTTLSLIVAQFKARPLVSWMDAT